LSLDDTTATSLHLPAFLPLRAGDGLEPPHRPPTERQEGLGAGTNQAFQCAENIKLGRATVAGIKSSPTSNFDVRLNMDPKLFDLDALSQQGK